MRVLEFLSDSFVIYTIAFIHHVPYFRGFGRQHGGKRVNMNMHLELPIMLETLYHFHSSAGVGITNRRTERVSTCLWMWTYNVLYRYVSSTGWGIPEAKAAKCPKSRKWSSAFEHYYNLSCWLTFTRYILIRIFIIPKDIIRRCISFLTW
jgi:hypothetical protein